MSERTDHVYLQDILDAIQAIEDYTHEINLETFQSDRKTFSATIREFEIIGEAMGKISDPVKQQYENVLWRDIKDFRNKLIHEYFGIDAAIVWNTIQEDLPELQREIAAIEASLPPHDASGEETKDDAEQGDGESNINGN